MGDFNIDISTISSEADKLEELKQETCIKNNKSFN